MKHLRLREMLHAIFDRRLYGWSFVTKSLFLLGFALIVPSYNLLLLGWPVLSTYVAVFSLYFLISALSSKNYFREFHVMDYWLAFLFLMLSVLAFAFSFVVHVENTAYGMFQVLLVFSLSVLGLFISTLEITVSGHRLCLRQNIGLTDNFIDRQQDIWKRELQGFPNSENIVKRLDSGRYIARLFQRGSFNLTVLWSCIVMEEVIDAAADGIIQKDPLKREDFRTGIGFSRPYPLQLKNLNYVHRQKSSRKNEEMTIKDLWDKVRNPIAHHPYIPSFDETYSALIIFVSFVEEFPKTLQAWKFPKA